MLMKIEQSLPILVKVKHNMITFHTKIESLSVLPQSFHECAHDFVNFQKQISLKFTNSLKP